MAHEYVAENTFTSRVERALFGRTRKSDETFGAYRKFAIAQTTSREVAGVCQDGGVVTTLLQYALKEGVFDGALVTQVHPEKPFYPVPKLATTPKEVLKAAGSKYICLQNPFALASEAEKLGKTGVAFVGTPCQIQAVRSLQMADSPKLSSVKLAIGLMCSGCFTYGLVTELIQKKQGIDPRRITKMNIKRKLLLAGKSGVTEIPLSEANEYKRKSCGACRDFSAELADVSVGGLGLDGWSFVVLRSKHGEELLAAAEKSDQLRIQPVEPDNSHLKLLVRMSQKKSMRL
jgi:coenzyme F420 hydrogenase subunit beta